MAIWACYFSCVETAVPPVAFELTVRPGVKARLLELWVEQNGTNSLESWVLVRTAPGIPAVRHSFQCESEEDPKENPVFAVTQWAQYPTVIGQPIRRAFSAAFGFDWVWTFPRGLVITSQTSICMQRIAGNNNSNNICAVVEA